MALVLNQKLEFPDRTLKPTIPGENWLFCAALVPSIKFLYLIWRRPAENGRALTRSYPLTKTASWSTRLALVR